MPFSQMALLRRDSLSIFRSHIGQKATKGHSMRNPAQPRCIRTEISAIIQIAMAAQKLTTLSDRNANSV
jgi:hypothetical protein